MFDHCCPGKEGREYPCVCYTFCWYKRCVAHNLLKKITLYSKFCTANWFSQNGFGKLIAIVNVQLEFNHIWQKQTMNKYFIKIQFRKINKIQFREKKIPVQQRSRSCHWSSSMNVGWHFFTLTSKMKVKQQRYILGRHSFVNDVSNFFADWITVFNDEKNISSNVCIIHKLTALSLTFVTNISSITFLSLDNQQKKSSSDL